MRARYKALLNSMSNGLLSLTARCWTCKGKDLTDDGICRTCAPTDVAAAPSARSAYGRDSVHAMIRMLHDDELLNDTVDEIAAMTILARDLMDMGDVEKSKWGMSEIERTNSLRLTLTGIADAKQKRQKLLMEQKTYMTADDFRVFLSELFLILRRTIHDRPLFEEVAAQVAGIKVGLRKSAA